MSWKGTTCHLWLQTNFQRWMPGEWVVVESLKQGLGQ